MLAGLKRKQILSITVFATAGTALHTVAIYFREQQTSWNFMQK